MVVVYYSLLVIKLFSKFICSHAFTNMHEDSEYFINPQNICPYLPLQEGFNQRGRKKCPNTPAHVANITKSETSFFLLIYPTTKGYNTDGSIRRCVSLRCICL